MNTHTIEVTKRNGRFRITLSVYGQYRNHFTYTNEKRAVRKVQELERSGYTVVSLQGVRP